MKELIIPEAALRDPKSVEMMRAWVAEQDLHCVLNIGVYENSGVYEPKAWGIIVSDFIRHFADAWQKKTGDSPEKTIEFVKSCVIEELNDPTSKASGDFA